MNPETLQQAFSAQADIPAESRILAPLLLLDAIVLSNESNFINTRFIL